MELFFDWLMEAFTTHDGVGRYVLFSLMLCD